MTLAETVAGMVRVLDERQLGKLCDTAGAQALYSFRYKHLGHVIQCHTVESVLQLEKDAYYSGRCECGRIGWTEGPVHELDIRGAYCSICRNSDVPVRLRHYCLAPATGEVPDARGAPGLIARVTVETGEPAYPVRRDGLTVFPTGRFVTALCGPELLDALAKGRVVKWHCWAEYDLEPALAGFSGEAYDIRCAAEGSADYPVQQWAKALAVSLVGKLGQRGRTWQWLPEIPPRFYYDQYHRRHTDGRVHRFQEIAGRHRMECLEGWAYDAVPAISAWVCASARMRLLSMLRCCGLAECWYMDTDCLFVTDVGYQRLVSAGWVRPGQLGFLQVKGCHEWFEPRAIKSYRTPNRRVQAGLSLDPESDRTAGERHRHSVWIATHLAAGTKPHPVRVTTGFERITPYRHGQIVAGGRCKPWHYWEE